MKMIGFFIPRKLSLTALGIQSHCTVRRKACRDAFAIFEPSYLGIERPVNTSSRRAQGLDHVAGGIVNMEHTIMRSSLAHLRKRRHVVLRRLQDGFLCFAQFFAQERAFSVWFAINNRSLTMQRGNEAAIQSDYQTTIGSRSHIGKTALTSARGDRCRFVLERRSRCNRSGAS